MKKLIYLLSLIILIIGCQNNSKKNFKSKCQLRYVEKDTVCNKTDSTNMVIFNVIHDYRGKHDKCSYNVLFHLEGQFQTKIIPDSLVY